MQERKWPYRNIPVKPEVYEELEGIKNEVQKEIGVKFDWSSFVWGVVIGGGATALALAIAKAIKKYQEEKKKEGGEV